MKRMFGYAMLAAPFIALFAYSVSTVGLFSTVGVFGFAAAIVVWVFVGLGFMS